MHELTTVKICHEIRGTQRVSDLQHLAMGRLKDEQVKTVESQTVDLLRFEVPA